ncbi:MAG: LysM peptidoglycan-binding domain-containing protein [Paludibacteraceae bacterium]|nr:LysM peptidoglycan-binding domain-containing protein [Paludibacteraceae bacterium]
MKKTLFILMTTALCAVSSMAQTLYQHEGTVKQSYNYWLYVPETYQEDKAELPLVVFLHGKSLCGTDLSRVRRYGPLSALQYGRRINALILAPQSPGESWKPEKVNRLIDWTFENFKVDTNRVYVIGMSMGGFGTMDYVGTYPQRVAAAIAMCGGSTLKDRSKMKDVPLWIIHGTDDRAVPVLESDKVHSDILKSGPNQTHYDRLDSVNHAMLARMFYLNQTYEWLFLHSNKSKQRVIHPTFDVREALPAAYKGLKSNSARIEVVNGKEAARQTTAQTPAPTTATAPKDTAKAEPEVATRAEETAAQERAAQERAAQERAAQEKAAQEAAAKKKAQEEAAKKKAQEEAAAKKKAQEEAARKKAQEAAKKKAEEEARRKAEAAKWHVVKEGEGLWTIAHKHGITVEQLRKMNNLTEKSVIHPGQKLRVKY